MYRSGNPGYETNTNLIIGQGLTALGDRMAVNFDGFSIFAGDASGECMESSSSDDAHNAAPSSQLKFKGTSMVSCWKKFATEQAFEAYCNDDAQRQKLTIFSQIVDEFKYMAVFGNPDINNGKDWVKVIQTNLEGLGGDPNPVE
jgi:uncharacterized protein with NRDE domain